MVRQPAGGADEAGHMDVVPAGVHHADLTPGRVACRHLAGVRQPRIFDDRQGVHVGADQHDRPVAVFQEDRRHPACLRSPSQGAGFSQFFRDPLRRFDLLPRQFGVGMQVRVQGNQLRELAH